MQKLFRVCDFSACHLRKPEVISRHPPDSTPGRFPEPALPDPWFGAIAQLGERLHGMQEVSGSIPLSSTKFLPKQKYLDNSKTLFC